MSLYVFIMSSAHWIRKSEESCQLPDGKYKIYWWICNYCRPLNANL